MPTASCSHRVGGEDSDQENYYIGIDVGTGSARACVANHSGDVVGLASKDIGLWQPKAGYYVCANLIPNYRE
jgi:glycerol kinase